MNKVLVFEHVVYIRNLENEFYHYCVKQQFSLIKYLSAFYAYSILYFFRIISKKKYFENRWSFLRDVKNLEYKIDIFWKSRKRKLTNIVTEGEIVWLSEYPEILLRELAKSYQVALIANSSQFKYVHQMYEKAIPGERTQIYDKFCSKLKRVENVEFTTVYNGKIFNSFKKYRVYTILYATYTCLALLIMGVCLGLVSLYFGTGNYLMPMFFSYFKVAYIPLLNILPVVLCIFLLYFILDRVWVSFLITSIVTMAFTWINYFKLLFRNDPLLASDLSLVSETMDMAGKYDIQLNWKIVCVIIACFLGTLASAFFVKGKIRSTWLKLAGIIVIIFVGKYFFYNIYINDELYKATQNNSLINRWSATQVYISKGFLYPFIHSINENADIPPVGYSEKAAKERLNSFEYSDIPQDKKVNVISIMLEAYNDFSKFDNLKFDIDVYEYLHQLQAESYTGELVTNIFAGGTINTERCFLTGFTALYNFRSSTNSYAYYFGEQGYTVEGSHPCYSWFYNRKNVNEYLGIKDYYFFENYYSELADGKIARDNVLFPQLIKLFETNKASRKPYFSFNVTYQNHGPYSSQKLTDIGYIKNQGYSEEEYNILNNYFSGIYSTNKEIETLIESFRAEKEPVVVILFGDHNPWMGDNNSVYKMLDINFDFGTEEGFYSYYNTPYIIWGNDSAKKTLGNGLKGKGPKIGPYFLMNEFFNLAGYGGNEFMKLSNELKADVDVIHTKNRYKEADVLTSELSSKAQQKLADFLQVEYYWRNNYKSTFIH